MMLTYVYRSISARPYYALMPAGAASDNETRVEDGPLHADYDGHPLIVDGLAHYIEGNFEGDRFHVT
jgi:hypothetical protein